MLVPDRSTNPPHKDREHATPEPPPLIITLNGSNVKAEQQEFSVQALNT